ncbi:hypothetical protein ACGFYA_04320 [Streptomyces sp. NPDC048305]|uniref:hypothetical protein n=1 Tax=Streptomyces sp. NPDC048305 TaxID=3365532 RepID=UPI0037210430
MNAFNQYPDQECRARELHEILGMATDEASVNVTRARSDASSVKASSPSLDQAATRNVRNVH